jgi:hypothetical protein
VDVEFTINDGPIHTVSRPTYNDRTDVYEYWIEIIPTDYSDGEITISATAYPDDTNNQPRVLSDLILYTNAHGTLQNYNDSSIVWADCDNGNDTTGDGSELNPFQTIERAYAQAGAGGTVYLKAGLNYLITNTLASVNHPYWTTITAAPGILRNEVRILGGLKHYRVFNSMRMADGFGLIGRRLFFSAPFFFSVPELGFVRIADIDLPVIEFGAFEGL